ncbi:MAG: hypothetical protein OXU45_09665 [Candidatus Melainabacteria bacterium]|nr:hypothetical protein [Candidatus Melainabacteria bacterium]
MLINQDSSTWTAMQAGRRKRKSHRKPGFNPPKPLVMPRSAREADLVAASKPVAKTQKASAPALKPDPEDIFYFGYPAHFIYENLTTWDLTEVGAENINRLGFEKPHAFFDSLGAVLRRSEQPPLIIYSAFGDHNVASFQRNFDGPFGLSLPDSLSSAYSTSGFLELLNEFCERENIPEAQRPFVYIMDYYDGALGKDKEMKAAYPRTLDIENTGDTEIFGHAKDAVLSYRAAIKQ